LLRDWPRLMLTKPAVPEWDTCCLSGQRLLGSTNGARRGRHGTLLGGGEIDRAAVEIDQRATGGRWLVIRLTAFERQDGGIVGGDVLDPHGDEHEVADFERVSEAVSWVHAVMDGISWGAWQAQSLRLTRGVCGVRASRPPLLHGPPFALGFAFTGLLARHWQVCCPEGLEMRLRVLTSITA
jgi:hypothetical protein